MDNTVEIWNHIIYIYNATAHEITVPLSQDKKQYTKELVDKIHEKIVHESHQFRTSVKHIVDSDFQECMPCKND